MLIANLLNLKYTCGVYKIKLQVIFPNALTQHLLCIVKALAFGPAYYVFPVFEIVGINAGLPQQ